MADGVGRPTIFTEALANKIITAIKNGAYVETAAQMCGVSKAVLYEWFKKGNRGESEQLRDFVDAVHKAQAEAEFRDLMVIGKAANGGAWQASAWRLERKFPDRYGLTRKLSLEVKKEVDRELDDFMERLERKLPRDVFALVCEALAPEPESAGEAEPAAGEGAGG